MTLGIHRRTFHIAIAAATIAAEDDSERCTVMLPGADYLEPLVAFCRISVRYFS